jgi:hypothetical protein
MNKGTTIIEKGQVESVEDIADGLRIKIRLREDGKTPIGELPYAFPLLPKTFQSVPKEGEGAFVIKTMSDNKESQRYYIGPIISQPQFQEKCAYQYGRGNALSVIEGGTVEPLEKISNYRETFGAFPKIEDVAVVGRGSQDIILRSNKDTTSDEVDIRCGIRTDSMYGNSSDGKAVVGKVVFNRQDPAYIQLKHKKNLINGGEIEANSVVNVVSDKINIISHKDENLFDLTDENQLINENDLENVMTLLHQVPHGDTLIKLLRVIIQAILTHVHPYAGMQASQANYTLEAANWLGKLDTILSKHVRIS